MQPGCSFPFCRETGCGTHLSLLYLTTSSCLSLSYSLGFSLLFWAFICVTSLSLFCAYGPCFVNRWTGAETWPYWQNSKKSPSFRSIIPLLWIISFLAKIVLTGQVQRDRTSPAVSGVNSQTHCPAILTSFSSFRDLDKDLKGGLYGLKTSHWSIHVHIVQGFHFSDSFPIIMETG